MVGQTLRVIDEECKAFLDYLSEYLSVVDKACGSRFGWDKIKSIIEDGYINLSDAGNLQDFLAGKYASSANTPKTQGK